MEDSSRKDGLRYTNAPARRQKIQDHILEHGFSTIAELSEAVGVSEMTVRRDVERLASEDRVRTVFGGVTLSSTVSAEPSGFSERFSRQHAAKIAIGTAALQTVGRSATIYLDSGTTTLELARLIEDKPGMTVVSHSLPVLAEMGTRQQVTVIGIGGQFQYQTQDFVAAEENAQLHSMRIPLLFLAAGGVGSDGVFCKSFGEVMTKRTLVKRSERVVLLADSEKFRSDASLRACGLDEIDEVITDSWVSDETVDMLHSHNLVVNLIEVPHTGRV
ncbi:MAG: DeoR/GlpR family DNA-binding transcription regulator [Beutenbergiaceae bacterium]